MPQTPCIGIIVPQALPPQGESPHIPRQFAKKSPNVAYKHHFAEPVPLVPSAGG